MSKRDKSNDAKFSHSFSMKLNAIKEIGIRYFKLLDTIKEPSSLHKTTDIKNIDISAIGLKGYYWWLKNDTLTF